MSKKWPERAVFLQQYAEMLGVGLAVVKKITGKKCRCIRWFWKNRHGELPPCLFLSSGESDQVFQLLECFDLHDLACRLRRVGDGLAGAWISAGAFFGGRLGVDIDLYKSWECEDPWA